LALAALLVARHGTVLLLGIWRASRVRSRVLLGTEKLREAGCGPDVRPGPGRVRRLLRTWSAEGTTDGARHQHLIYVASANEHQVSACGRAYHRGPPGSR